MRSLVLFLLALCFFTSHAQEEVALEQLKDHINDSVKVKGRISGAKYLDNARNTPTFINVGAPYPNQFLTIVIWGDVRKKMDYDPADKKFLGGTAVVTGKVELYKNKPQIVIHDPSQLQIFYDEEVPAAEIPPIQQRHK